MPVWDTFIFTQWPVESTEFSGKKSGASAEADVAAAEAIMPIDRKNDFRRILPDILNML
jgi:hypothetical protein